MHAHSPGGLTNVNVWVRGEGLFARGASIRETRIILFWPRKASHTHRRICRPVWFALVIRAEGLAGSI